VNIPELLLDKRVCVCAGAGGVGKTTTSAAIALGVAAAGAKVAVVTIDPARRLANALGLEELGNEPTRVSPRRLAAAGVDVEGELWAMMLDPKRTFDELIERIAPNARRAAEIKANRVYRELSSAVSGSQEFTAISKLHDLLERDEFDLLVLDTPPARTALDFLDAPGRLASFVEGRALKAFLRPTGAGIRLLGAGTRPLLAAIGRITGVDLVADLTTFFGLLGDMTADFDARARTVEGLLHSPETAFLLVTSAQAEPIDEAIRFHRTLREGELPFAGVVVNRFHHRLEAADGAGSDGDAAGAPDGELASVLDEELAHRVRATLADYDVLARRDGANVARLEAALDGEPVLLVPLFDDEVHDVAGLLRIGRYLFASDDERARLIADVVA
jgi:anion-transporting  ArsA/GET3 family ATPase